MKGYGLGDGFRDPGLPVRSGHPGRVGRIRDVGHFMLPVPAVLLLVDLTAHLRRRRREVTEED